MWRESSLFPISMSTVHGFVREVYEGLEAVISLSEIDSQLPLAEMYEGVEFSPDLTEEEA